MSVVITFKLGHCDGRFQRLFSKENFSKETRIPQLKEWCPGHLWAPSCYHKTFRKSLSPKASQSVGQKGYEKTDIVPVVVIAEETEKAHKTGYVTLYNKLSGEKHQK